MIASIDTKEIFYKIKYFLMVKFLNKTSKRILIEYLTTANPIPT